MDITFLGHSSFKIRGKNGIVVCDPFSPKIGFPFPKVSADIVTISHHHFDHFAIDQISGTSRKDKPYVIDSPGEYELLDIAVSVHPSFHDAENGKLRGKNNITVIRIEGIAIAHLGDLGHLLSDSDINSLGAIDVLIIPVGGEYTIGSKQAVEIAEAIEPSIVVPMHYRRPEACPKKWKW
ncbi:MAG: Zn-dependent hydrolase of the beta-lactamase fold protein [Parcubacteria group bacterium GW2011_GWA2_42_28]|nr:MAG: Zn-dependent hydrolase of the beta-lactamase fold protein [Parcubacteria group bacterium GW2011_GWA2_42_28]